MVFNYYLYMMKCNCSFAFMFSCSCTKHLTIFLTWKFFSVFPPCEISNKYKDQLFPRNAKNLKNKKIQQFLKPLTQPYQNDQNNKLIKHAVHTYMYHG
jgi:hypothetical protein